MCPYVSSGVQKKNYLPKADSFLLYMLCYCLTKFLCFKSTCPLSEVFHGLPHPEDVATADLFYV
jgi:hypothetical protein